MKQILWRIGYVWHICCIARISPRMAWGMSETAWEDNDVFPSSPREAVLSELSYWTD